MQNTNLTAYNSRLMTYYLFDNIDLYNLYIHAKYVSTYIFNYLKTNREH